MALVLKDHTASSFSIVGGTNTFVAVLKDVTSDGKGDDILAASDLGLGSIHFAYADGLVYDYRKHTLTGASDKPARLFAIGSPERVSPPTGTPNRRRAEAQAKATEAANAEANEKSDTGARAKRASAPERASESKSKSR